MLTPGKRDNLSHVLSSAPTGLGQFCFSQGVSQTPCVHAQHPLEFRFLPSVLSISDGHVYNEECCPAQQNLRVWPAWCFRTRAGLSRLSHLRSVSALDLLQHLLLPQRGRVVCILGWAVPICVSPVQPSGPQLILSVTPGRQVEGLPPFYFLSAHMAGKVCL